MVPIRRPDQIDRGFGPQDGGIANVRFCDEGAEVVFFAFIPAFAAAMARGYGALAHQRRAKWCGASSPR
jgi:uncharacterized membrane protein